MFYTKSAEAVVNELNSSIETGLSTTEVEERKATYGLNKLEAKKKKTLLWLFFQQINDVLIYILIFAAIISIIVSEYSDAIIIGLVIVLNATIGIIQESKAEKSLEALQKLSSPKALVKRSSEIIEVDSSEIVPGDIIIIDAGRYIPCDIRLIETANFKAAESSLTGESLPVEKTASLILEDKSTPIGDRKNMIYSSTLATQGRAIGIAVGTGMNTEIGKIASMLNEDKKELTPLQKKLDQLGKILGVTALVICILIFAIGYFQGRELFELFLTAISLAVAAIPEGLPAIVTIVLAIGVQKMIKENAIVRKLPAVETLGSVNIICSDKTGTLTQNKMTVTKFFTNGEIKDISALNKDNYSDNLLLENLVLCSDATITTSGSTGDPTEIALIQMGLNVDTLSEELNKLHARVNELPFDSDRKLMSTVNKYNNSYYVMTKGAVDNLLKKSSKILIGEEITLLTEELKNQVLQASSLMSNEALRVISCAYKEITNPDDTNLENDLIFIGFVAMIDPPRLEVKDSIALCKKAGIDTVMITGDHKDTAFAIAKTLGIADNKNQCISGTELDLLSQEELNSSIENLKVFARVSPEHKVKIVQGLKSKDNIVSMTGDGVNDAPSLKAADIGVAMGITGTDVAKGAADLILTDDNFSTIVSAIEEGRNIYNNIKKSIVFLISCNMGELIAIFIAILLNWATPLSPIHILWINLVTDSFPALALGVDPNDKDVMNNKPRNSKESIFSGELLNVVGNGLLIGLITLAAFRIGYKNYPDSLIHAQTMAFLVMSISELIHSLNMRNKRKSIFTIGLFTNKYLIYSILLGLSLQLILVFTPGLNTLFKITPLNLNDWIVVLGLSIVPLVINELVKLIKRLAK
ncbi:calcium-translocating P-type ATPase, SERCA-type [Clostridium grantii]|uniref:P-type Ca(2+) transporter n=1 Tax=Clostridium grantii DSM 8605 TaxID=1121316 RepID=A0A1M5ULP0_9CLOT|nr:calcium-translocating P-type ATPase, SERCA-type [Clostridium grantii]SHH63909.1 Ca2+-transporting ATPase [Clostridium grantii DSM 8605]